MAYVSPGPGATDAAAALNDEAAPFASVHAAVAAVRAARKAGGERVWVVLREGTHYLGGTLELSAEDSHLSIVNYPGEARRAPPRRPSPCPDALRSDRGVGTRFTS